MTPTDNISREEVMNILINYGPSIDRYHYQELLDGIDNLSSLRDKSSQIGEMIEKKIKQSLFTHEIESLQELLDEIDSLTRI